MAKLVEVFIYKGVRFDIMSETDPEDNDAVYYYWDRNDVVGAGSASFLPEETVQEIKWDAMREIDGRKPITEAQIQEQMAILKRRMQPN